MSIIAENKTAQLQCEQAVLSCADSNADLRPEKAKAIEQEEEVHEQSLKAEAAGDADGAQGQTRDNSHVEAWLHTLDYNCPAGESQTPCRYSDSSDDEEQKEEEASPATTNPFRSVAQKQEEEEELAERQDECQLEQFTQRIQLRDAVPAYALSDAIFWVDKPKEAVALGVELPVVPLSLDYYQVGVVFKLLVCEVYSPFQFWFHAHDDCNVLENLCMQLTSYYTSLRGSAWQLPVFLMKSGYLCAVLYEGIWRRARILREPEPSASGDHVIGIYLVDYGSCVQSACTELYFLHQMFAEQPALVMRGTLADVYPLALHWPPDATAGFKRLVHARELHALLKDIDVGERTLFVSLSHTQDCTGASSSISSILIEADLAGRSLNYSEQVRRTNCGRRLRYVREQLPSFDMLETNVFPHTATDFEQKFDDIVYMPDFYQNFQPPKLKNPFHRGLMEALNAWLQRFKPVELAWRQEQQQQQAQLEQQQEERLQRYLHVKDGQTT
ncbi:hypothetical protein KR222_002667 [Zaprionus bogoriensis]|nr:hypothetical protein KR222_002667 [Zaprionus bogoriensis]